MSKKIPSIAEVGYTTKVYTAAVHHFYLSEEIGQSMDYSDWIDIIRHCEPQNSVYIHINCFGGDVFATLQLMRAMNECQGQIVCSVEGACMSAATFIFMSADIFEVSQHSMFMFHNYSAMMGGKGGEMYDNIVHEREWSKNLLSETYKDFFSEAEIQQILDGKDIYMDDVQVIKRLKKMGKDVVSVKNERAELADAEEEIPKKPRKAPKAIRATKKVSK